VNDPSNLESLLGTVVTTTSTQACLDTSNGASWTIEYIQNFGDLPLIVPDTTKLVSASKTPIVVQTINTGKVVVD
jgi:hypothetical protein